MISIGRWFMLASRRATRARLQGDAGEFYHWAKVAAVVGRIALQAAMGCCHVNRASAFAA
jgi:hypothetical protein